MANQTNDYLYRQMAYDHERMIEAQRRAMFPIASFDPQITTWTGYDRAEEDRKKAREKLQEKENERNNKVKSIIAYFYNIKK